MDARGTPPTDPEAEGTPLPVTVHVGTLELREERPVVLKEQVRGEQLTFRREVRTRTETVSVEVRRETLHITVGPGEGTVFVEDDPVQPGEIREVLLYDERVVVGKRGHVTEEVRIGKRTVTEVQQHSIDLLREELVTEEMGTPPATPSPEGP